MDPTSYDYDAPLTESGDPTEKFFKIRQVIGKYLDLPTNIPKPFPSTKRAYGSVNMSCFLGDIFDFIKSYSSTPVKSYEMLTFEALSQPNGFLMYSTRIPYHPTDPVVVKIPGLKDRAHVFVNQTFQGILSREFDIFSLPVSASSGDTLEVLVENQARINFGGGINEVKGITGKVSLGSKELNTVWTHDKVPLHIPNVIKDLSERKDCMVGRSSSRTLCIKSFRPSFFKGTFILNSNPEKKETQSLDNNVIESEELSDTFLSLKGWRKGIVWINGFNVGRYWPVAGPQVTLFVPKTKLFPADKTNEILIFEQEFSPCFDPSSSSCSVEFVTEHVINASVPDT